jgi:hypothetical protein
LKARLSAATATIATASAAFDRSAQNHALHQIAPQNIVAPDVTVAEMEKVYTQRMAKLGAPGRYVYDAIVAVPEHGKCPLCTLRTVTTLDHHLPKAHFPVLAVAPLNLIPACSDCNKAKLAAVPTTPEEVGLHPYYDDLGDEAWLAARVVETRPAALRFSVAPPAAWDAILSARVVLHFKTLGLAALFASEAADELVNIRYRLTQIMNSDPHNGVRTELDRRAQSCAAAQPNRWRTAAYRAWHASDWFCAGGFLAAR